MSAVRSCELSRKTAVTDRRYSGLQAFLTGC